jgi:steroid delta-isomerase-like uncharacterized protein
MSEQGNVNTVVTQFDAVNGGDREGWIEARTEDFVVEQPGAPGPLNREQHWDFIGIFRTAFPDLQFDVTRTIAQGDQVAAHWTATGTHNGPLRTPTGDTLPPTNKTVAIKGSSTFQLRDEKILKEWAFWDMTSLLGQLGVMPAG